MCPGAGPDVLEDGTSLSTTGIRTLPWPACSPVAIPTILHRLLRQGNTSCYYFHESDSCSSNQIYFLWNPAVQCCVHNSLQANVIQPSHPISSTWYIPLKYGPSPHSERSSFYELHAENNYSWSTLHFVRNPTLQTFIAFNVCRQTVSVGNVINVVQCPTSTDLI